MEYDLFISHAFEDKNEIAQSMANELVHLGYKVWYDDFSLQLGDSLRPSIDRGLINSRYGVVIFSPAFLNKNWTIYELNSLVQKENLHGEKVILPIWHNVTKHHIAAFSLSMLDRVAANTADGMPSIISKIIRVIGAPKNSFSKPVEDEQYLYLASTKTFHTLALYNEWHSPEFKKSVTYVTDWLQSLQTNHKKFPSLSRIEQEGGDLELNIFRLIHFYEKWALLSKSGVVDKILIFKLLCFYSNHFERYLLTPLCDIKEDNSDFINLMKLIKKEILGDIKQL